jgi:hypothetical protein
VDVLQFFPSDLAEGRAARALCSKDEKIGRKDGEKGNNRHATSIGVSRENKKSGTASGK